MPVDGGLRVRARWPQLDAEIRAGRRPAFRPAPRASSRGAADQIRVFQCFDFVRDGYVSVNCRRVASGRHCVIYLADGADRLPGLGDSPERVIAEIRATFDDLIQPTITEWFGPLAIPREFLAQGNAVDERISIVLMDIRDRFRSGYVAGYFNPADLEPTALGSNQHPVFFMDLDPGTPGDPGRRDNEFYRTLAHEFQHMVNFSRRRARGLVEERWLDEGLATFAEWVLSSRLGGPPATGLAPSPHLSRFLENPSICLTDNREAVWFDDRFLFRQYGASFLFVFYLVEQFGGVADESRAALTRRFVEQPCVGAAAVEAALAPVGVSFVEVVRDWLLANHVNDPVAFNGRWGYASAVTRLGPQAQKLAAGALAGERQLWGPGGSTTVGGEGETPANAGVWYDLGGSGHLELVLRARSGPLTPFLASLDHAGHATVRAIPLNASGEARFGIELEGLERAILMPVALSASPVEGSGVTAPPIARFHWTSAPRGVMLWPIPHPAFDDGYFVMVKSVSSMVATPSLRLVTAWRDEALPAMPTGADRTLFLASCRLSSTDGTGFVAADTELGSASFAFCRAALTSQRPQVTLGNLTLATAGMSDGDAPLEASLSDARPVDRSLAGAVPLSLPVLVGLRAPSVAARLTAPLPALVPPLGTASLALVNLDSSALQMIPVAIEAGPTMAASLSTSGRYLFVSRGAVVSGAGGPASAAAGVAERADMRVLAVPNPARLRAQLRVSLAGVNDPDLTVHGEILDGSSRRVMRCEFEPGANGDWVAWWDLRNENLQPVANGVYHCRVTCDLSTGRRLRASGKLAVLR